MKKNLQIEHQNNMLRPDQNIPKLNASFVRVTMTHYTDLVR